METGIQIGTFLAQSIITATFALLAYKIQKQNVKLTENKLLLDVYEKRLKLYLEFSGFLRHCLVSSKIKEDKYRAFLQIVQESEFLFGKIIFEFGHEITRHANNLRDYENTLEDKEIDIKEFGKVSDATKKDFEENQVKYRESKKWMRREIDSMNARFISFLDLSSVSRPISISI